MRPILCSPGPVRLAASLPAVAASLLALGACTAGPDEWDVLMPDQAGAEVIRVSGAVAHLDLEGGLFVIRAADGTRYNPNNLPASYRVDGTPVEADVLVRDDVASIGMVGPVIDIVRLRRTGEAPAAPDSTAGGAPPLHVGVVPRPAVPASLASSSWKLTRLGGTATLAGAEATLSFRGDGTVAGRGSCNRFSGPVDVKGDSIAFGALASTRMACPEAISRQEDRFFEALRDAARWEIEDSELLVFGRDAGMPLRFAPATEE